MTSLQQASLLTVVALMIGMGLVTMGSVVGVPNASPVATDDMGTSGQGSPEDALPSATSSLR